MANITYLVFAATAFFLALIPLPWHLQAWNSGTCLFMLWTALGCLIHFVGGVIWADNLNIHSKVYCDIATKLIVGLSVALPSSSLCINRRLYLIASVNNVSSTKAEKRRAIYIDLAIGIGFPVLVMILHYVVQGHRFDIIEDIGCWPSTVNMLPSYFLVWIWPILIGLVSMGYCILSLRAFLRRRQEFNNLLAANPNVSASRYFRLMALATLDITSTTPLAIYFMVLNLTTEPLQPWVSWADTKWHFSRVDTYPAWVIALSPSRKAVLDLNIWLFPACGILFFTFFGLAEEARRNYKNAFLYVFKLLYSRREEQSLPSFLPRKKIAAVEHTKTDLDANPTLEGFSDLEGSKTADNTSIRTSTSSLSSTVFHVSKHGDMEKVISFAGDL